MEKVKMKKQTSFFSLCQRWCCCWKRGVEAEIEIAEVVESGVQTDGNHVLTFFNEEELRSFVKNISKTSEWSPTK